MNPRTNTKVQYYKKSNRIQSEEITIKNIGLNLLAGILQFVECVISILLNNSVLDRTKKLDKNIILVEYNIYVNIGDV